MIKKEYIFPVILIALDVGAGSFTVHQGKMLTKANIPRVHTQILNSVS